MRSTKAGEDEPELIVDFATLTGAARIALGPDLPALFSNDDALADQTRGGRARTSTDPLWRMPMWDAYDEMLKSDVADLANAAGSPMAGAVVAAMFLKRFVPKDIALGPFRYLCVAATKAKPGRPKGGEALGLRAVFAALSTRYGQKRPRPALGRFSFSDTDPDRNCNISATCRFTSRSRDGREREPQ